MLTRLLAVARGSGSFPDVGYSMGADETAFWSDMAALLDPAAYELVASTGSTVSRTVPGGQTYYLLGGWNVAQATPAFLREPDAVNNAVAIPSGETISTQAAAGAHMYLCKPALVNSDSRYSTDPRGLFFTRLRALGSLPAYSIGAANTGTGTVDSTFPTDFTYGIITWNSTHDCAWSGLLNAAATLTFNLNNEISDVDAVRIGQAMVVPFDRTVFTKFRSRGASGSEGACQARYVKLSDFVGTW